MMSFSNHHYLITVASTILLLSTCNAQGGLRLDYYAATCPSVEAIVKHETSIIISRAPTLAAALLRLHFHDCFVRGCDGSVLLNSTKGNTAEKDSPPNFTVRGYGSVDRVKAAVEKTCPGIVSCADILALVARDAISILNGPFWPVPLGRRDGTISRRSEALTNIPPPTSNISALEASFASKGLDTKDLVVLSGSHTIGNSHCSSFSARLYNFSGTGRPDPALDSEYVPHLKSKCSPTDNTTIVEMDPGSFLTFDTHYYTNVAKRRGLFTSDWSLLTDPETAAYVRQQAVSPPYAFFQDFANSMVKMGSIEVLTGNQGEIRKHCAFVN